MLKGVYMLLQEAAVWHIPDKPNMFWNSEKTTTKNGMLLLEKVAEFLGYWAQKATCSPVLAHPGSRLKTNPDFCLELGGETTAPVPLKGRSAGENAWEPRPWEELLRDCWLPYRWDSLHTHFKDFTNSPVGG